MKEFIINVSPVETRVALTENNRLVEMNVERHENRSVVGSIYKGVVDSVIPGIQAAFVDIGFGKNGFLYVSDIAGAVDTDGITFEEGHAKPKRGVLRRQPPSIDSVLKKGQKIIVQVAKDMLGTKGVRLTTFVTLPGRLAVLMPTVNDTGISKKIDDEQERDRLRKIIQELRPKKMGMILRTASEGRPREDFEQDINYLQRVWARVNKKARSGKAPCILHADLTPVLRTVRDTFTADIDRLTIDDEEQHDQILDFLESFAPTLKKRCKLYKGKQPLFDKMGVEKEIEKALQRKVFLKSGGYLCIDQTEALVAIDVNTGRFTSTGHLDDTVYQTNMEAASEIARQVRLRDLGGIIVIDFIDMRFEKHRRELFETLAECLKGDRAKTTISEISELGMIEMTRKRVKHNLLKALSQPCPYCDGSGMVRSVTTITYTVIRELQSLFCKSKEKKVTARVHPDVARRLNHEERRLLDEVAVKFDRELDVEPVAEFHIGDMKFVSARTGKEITPD